MASPPTIQILEKVDYSKQHIVSLPDASFSPLAPSSLRLQSKIIGLTTNNFSYARFGNLLGWWDIHTLPPNTPAPYNDASTYGRISAWGYAEIIESTVPDIPAGKSVYGYLPIGTLPVDVRVEFPGLKSQVVVLNEHRQHLWKIYNRYEVCPPIAELEKEKSRDFLGWDSLMQGLFGTSYNLNAHGFAWDDTNRLHPGGEGEWTAEDANLDDSAVILLSASGKTAMAFAHQLRHNRPKQHQPKAVIGVCSSKSKETTEKGGFYDHVLLYSESSAAKELVGRSSPHRVLLIDFGAREGATETWNNILSSLSVPLTFVTVGGEVKPLTPEAATKRLEQMWKQIVVNASLLREKGIETGGDKYFEEFYRAFDDFKRDGGIPGVTLKWENGMEAWGKAWDRLCRDEVAADTGLVFKL
ncbi:hypothetical protein K469DRAFT_645813 [Zopfia rhizophila CBS 207.26]|uniref:Uncharacterized protein n=1 Tax=Zopfia rhizophila CBS 207.26 TaxID=1314779 RepID=A0A6A6DA73_9PEZI|nr:hypothetical protein K469DRAFT_645813 [Zopfia rhizophila CBS 207.26]